MKIDKIEIAGFGKLNHFTLDFDSGLNLILGDNESGKSTICDFLLCMLYDMPNDGKRATLSENLRRKYKPWKGENFGGRIFFTDDSGKKYILEKSFGKTQRSDRSKLLDAESWFELDSGENIGERLFGLSREGFLKTLYIKSLDVGAMSGGGEEVLAKLSNMETSGDEDVSYLNIKNALEKEMFSLLSKTGRGGKIATLYEEERRLSLELSKLEHKTSLLKEDEERIRAFKEKIDALSKKISECESVYETAFRHEQFIAQQKTYESKNIIAKRLESEQERLKELYDNRNLTASDNNNQALVSELSQKETKRDKITTHMSTKMAMFTAIFVLIIFVVLGAVIKEIPLFTTIGVICSFIISIGTYILNRKNQTKREVLDAEIAELKQKIEAEEKREENETLIKETEKTIEELKGNLSAFNTNEKTVFTQEEIEYQGEQVSELSFKLREYKDKLKSLNEEHYNLSVSIAKQSGDGKSVGDIHSELLAIREEIKLCEKEFSAYKKASEWLQKAHDEIKQNYAPLLNKKTEEIFKTLTKNKYNGVRLAENLDLNYKNEYDEIVESGHLSQGAYDLLYISLKFSAMSILCEKIPPVILDDAFIQLDDERLKLMVDFIKNNEKFSQVILFSCHKKTSEIFKDVKILELI